MRTAPCLLLLGLCATAVSVRAQPETDGASGPETDAADPIPVRVTSDDPAFALAYRTGSSYRSNPMAAAVEHLYEEVCRERCDLTLPRGEYRFAIEDDGRYYEDGGLYRLTEPTDVHLSLHRPRVQRALGVLMLLAGLAVGGVFYGRLVAHGEERGRTFARDIGVGTAGAAFALVGLFTLVLAETEAHIALGPRD